MDGNIFWAILLFLSGCVIIRLCRYINELKESIDVNAIGEAMKQWDDDYKTIIAHYGSVDAFNEAFKTDFDLFRSNVLTFIGRIEEIRKGIGRAIAYVEGSKTDMVTQAKLEALRKAVDSSLSNILSDMTTFIKNEEEAHQDYRYVDEVLERLSKEIKDINFYE